MLLSYSQVFHSSLLHIHHTLHFHFFHIYIHIHYTTGDLARLARTARVLEAGRHHRQEQVAEAVGPGDRCWAQDGAAYGRRRRSRGHRKHRLRGYRTSSRDTENYNYHEMNILFTMTFFVRTYSTYIHTYMHAYIIHLYICTCMHSFFHTYIVTACILKPFLLSIHTAHAYIHTYSIYLMSFTVPHCSWESV